MTLKEIRERNPNWSSYICFAYWVSGKKIKNGKLRKEFLKEVDKEDYLKSEQEEIIRFLIELKN